LRYIDEGRLAWIARDVVQNIKLAGWADVADEAVERGLNPAKWLKGGWKSYEEFAHPSATRSRGWLGGSKYTKYLPIGPKSLTVGVGLAAAPAAFAKEDGTGRGHSRGQRIGGWVGSNLGGVAGSMSGKAGLAGLVPVFGGMLLGQAAGETIGKAVG